MSKPWKCNHCGREYFTNVEHHWHGDNFCPGALHLYDRRAPDPQVAAVVKKCIRERMEKLESWGHDGKEEKCNLCQEHATLAALEGEGR